MFTSEPLSHDTSETFQPSLSREASDLPSRSAANGMRKETSDAMSQNRSSTLPNRAFIHEPSELGHASSQNFHSTSSSSVYHQGTDSRDSSHKENDRVVSKRTTQRKRDSFDSVYLEMQSDNQDLNDRIGELEARLDQRSSEVEELKARLQQVRQLQKEAEDKKVQNDDEEAEFSVGRLPSISHSNARGLFEGTAMSTPGARPERDMMQSTSSSSLPDQFNSESRRASLDMMNSAASVADEREYELRDKIEQAQSKNTELRSDNAKLKMELAVEKARCAEREEKIESAEHALEEVQKAVNNEREERRQIQDRNQDLQQEISRLQAEKMVLGRVETLQEQDEPGTMKRVRTKLVTGDLLSQIVECPTEEKDSDEEYEDDDQGQSATESGKAEEPEPEAMGIVEELEQQITNAKMNEAALELEKERTRIRLLEEMQHTQVLINRLAVLEKAASDYQKQAEGGYWLRVQELFCCSNERTVQNVSAVESQAALPAVSAAPVRRKSVRIASS